MGAEGPLDGRGGQEEGGTSLPRPRPTLPLSLPPLSSFAALQSQLPWQLGKKIALLKKKQIPSQPAEKQANWASFPPAPPPSGAGESSRFLLAAPSLPCPSLSLPSALLPSQASCLTCIPRLFGRAGVCNARESQLSSRARAESACLRARPPWIALLSCPPVML